MAIYNLSQLQQILRRNGWQEKHISLMAAIGMYESSGDSNIINPRGEYSVGLWQINIAPHLKRTWKENDLKNPDYNAQIALYLFNRGGFPHWINSYNKAMRDYKGIYSQSKKIYTGESGNIIIANNNIPVTNSNISTLIQELNHIKNIEKKKEFSFSNLSTNEKYILGALSVALVITITR